jgi:HTH-type transcriptional regulator/antitoxin HipB
MSNSVELDRVVELAKLLGRMRRDLSDDAVKRGLQYALSYAGIQIINSQLYLETRQQQSWPATQPTDAMREDAGFTRDAQGEWTAWTPIIQQPVGEAFADVSTSLDLTQEQPEEPHAPALDERSLLRARGQALRQRRERLGIGQATLARRAGVKQARLSEIERGKTVAIPEVLDRLQAQLTTLEQGGEQEVGADAPPSD